MLGQITALQNVAPTSPTVQLSDITGGISSDYMQLPLEPQKSFTYLFLTSTSLRGSKTYSRHFNEKLVESPFNC